MSVPVLRWALWCFWLVAGCWFASPAVAVDPELEAFVDGVLRAARARQKVVGATVAVVQDGERLLQKGYGFANVAEDVAVDAERTLFRVGSISKVPVWMALQQQLEAGALKLSDPVSAHLQQVVLEDRFPAPVTLRHLATHSAGFEDRVFGLFTDAPSRVPALVDYLQANVPHQLFLPGSVVAYSNYGSALAARVIENAAGEPFAAYVDQSVFKPLGMRSTYDQSPTEDFRNRVSQAYRYQGLRPLRLGIEYVVPEPAGALSASADDMARLMIELLNPSGSAVLSAASKARLLSRAQSVDPTVNGLSLGLYEMTVGDGERAIGHGGDTIAFHSRMVLWPEQRLGLFVSTNTETGAETVETLVTAFVEHYGLGPLGEVQTQTVSLQAIPGVYQPSRREAKGPLKLLAMLSQLALQVSPDGDRLRVAGMGNARTLEPLGDGLFVDPNDGVRLKYEAGQDGPDRVTLSNIPVQTYLRVQPIDQAPLNLGFLAAVTLLNLILLLRLPYTAVRPPAAAMARDVDGSVSVSLLFWITAALVVAVPALYFVLAASPYEFMMTEHRQFPKLLWLPVAIAFGALLQIIAALNGWRLSRWWPGRRLFLTLVAAGNGVLALWYYRWNLHPFSFPDGF